MPLSNLTQFTTPTTPYSRDFLLNANASAALADLGFSAFSDGLPALLTAAAWKAGLHADHRFDVRDYGAVVDGVTNDSAAVQLAIDAAEAAGGGEVYLPAGICNIGSTGLVLDADAVWLVGSGRAPSQILYDAAGVAISVGTAGGTARNYCGIRNLYVRKGGTAREAGSKAIVQYSGQSLCIRDVWVNSFATGIELDGNGDGGGMGYLVAPRLDNIRFSGCLITLDIGTPTTAILATGLHIVGPGKTASGSFGIRQESSVGQGNYFFGVSIETVQTGVQLGGNSQHITGLRLEACTTGITFLDATVDACSIMGAHTFNCTTDVGNAPAGSQYNIVQLNGVLFFHGDGTAGTELPIMVLTAAGTQDLQLRHVAGTGAKWRNSVAGDIFHINANGSVKAQYQLEIVDNASWAPLKLTARATPPATPQTGEVYLDSGANRKDLSKGWMQYDGANWQDVGGVASVTTGIVAVSPGVQGDGPLTAAVNVVATVGLANDAVTMPSATPGREIVIINNGANTLEIWPASGDDLGAGVNTAVTLAAGTNRRYLAIDFTNWEIV